MAAQGLFQMHAGAFSPDLNCNFVGLIHHPFWLKLDLAPFVHHFSTF